MFPQDSTVIVVSQFMFYNIQYWYISIYFLLPIIMAFNLCYFFGNHRLSGYAGRHDAQLSSKIHML